MKRLLLIVLLLAGCIDKVSTDRVIMQTELGAIEIVLDTEAAPVTAGHFRELVRRGSFDGARFYRVVRDDNDNGLPPIDIVQGGIQNDPQPYTPVAHESTRVTGLAHVDGTISMARGAPGTASTEFFICVGDQPALDHGGSRHPDGRGYAAFGRVVKGMDIIRSIHATPAERLTGVSYVAGQVLVEPVAITGIRIR